MSKPKTETDFDLTFVRDLMHRHRMMLRDLAKVEKSLKKHASFEHHARRTFTKEEVAAATKFYEELFQKRQEQQP